MNLEVEQGSAALLWMVKPLHPPRWVRQSRSRSEEHITQTAVPHQLPALGVMCEETQNLCNHENDACFADGCQHAIYLFHGQRQGFFADDMHALFRGPGDELLVHECGQANVYDVRPGGLEQSIWIRVERNAVWGLPSLDALFT